MIKLIQALIAALVAAINTPRENTAEVARLKSEVDELKGKLAEEDAEDAELEALAPQIDEVLALATAARPPTAEQLEAVKSGTTLSQDPAQPAGAKAPGNPELVKKAESGELSSGKPEGAHAPGEEDEEEEETVSDDERVESLKAENSKDELVKKAEKLGIEVHSKDNMTTIATAIVEKENQDK